MAFDEKLYRIQYHLKNKSRLNKNGRLYYKANKKRIFKRTSENVIKRMISWKNFIPNEAMCGICNKEIFFYKKDAKISIHFDHRHNGTEPIKHSTSWLNSHSRSPKNEALWKSCNFGMLCNTCNKMLPTKNRVDYLLRVMKYALTESQINDLFGEYKRGSKKA